jgi:pyruvate/2-oxoglutarate dehydrogenase complex dihydrolipoamide dehydrogenase (E3) component
MITELTAPYRGLGPVLIATGRIVEPADADAFIAAGGADAVGMNRALITDPDMPRKAREGRVDSVMRCIGCNVCNEHYHAGSPIACGQNPRTGRELHLARPAEADRVLRIAVVGGGPTGLAAAAEAGAAGHDVRLFEAATELGGQLAIARSAPAKAELTRSLLSNYASLLDRPNVQIELESPAVAEELASGGYDRILIATGAEPYSPPITGRGIETLSAWDVLAGARPSDRVVIADWGGDSIGLDAAEVLSADGIRATLVSGALVAGEHLHQYLRTSYLGRMYRAGVELVPHLALSDAAEGQINFYNVFAPDLTTRIEAGALVISLGRSPRTALVAELEAAGTRFATAGDVRSPRGIEEATLEGTLVMRDLLGLPAGAGQVVAA